MIHEVQVKNVRYIVNLRTHCQLDFRQSMIETVVSHSILSKTYLSQELIKNL